MGDVHEGVYIRVRPVVRGLQEPDVAPREGHRRRVKKKRERKASCARFVTTFFVPAEASRGRQSAATRSAPRGRTRRLSHCRSNDRGPDKRETAMYLVDAASGSVDQKLPHGDGVCGPRPRAGLTLPDSSFLVFVKRLLASWAKVVGRSKRKKHGIAVANLHRCFGLTKFLKVRLQFAVSDCRTYGPDSYAETREMWVCSY